MTIDADEFADHLRHRYTREQMTRYFERIAVPAPKRVYNVSNLGDEEQLAYLRMLFRHQLCKVPWENLTQHYSWHRVIHLQPNYLFRKIVTNPGTGGYCMEANYFFHLILWNLGFRCQIAGSRIWRADANRYGGFTHLVNIVGIAGTKYLLDGGMGPNGPHRPLELEAEAAVPQIEPAEMKLSYERIPGTLDAAQKVWVFKHRWTPDRDWVPVYCFTDLEFLPADIESMNFAPMMNRQSYFTQKVMIVRFTTDREVECDGEGPGSPGEEALEGEVDGSLSLNDSVLKWRRRGKKVMEVRCRSEEERLKVLKKYFGVEFSEEDREAILGTSGMVGPASLAGFDDGQTS